MIERRTPLKAKPGSVRAWRERTRAPMPKTGPRTRERGKWNAELNKLGITWCEIRLDARCLGRLHLSWAHYRKSRFLQTPEDWMCAARACQYCHSTIEAMSHIKMEKIVLEAIARRGREDVTFIED